MFLVGESELAAEIGLETLLNLHRGFIPDEISGSSDVTGKFSSSDMGLRSPNVIESFRLGQI
jgi:hypothetical protein